MDPSTLMDIFRRELPAHGSVYYQERIPPRKLAKVAGQYEVDPSEVLVLYDDTVFGGAAEGFIVTPTHVGFKALVESPILLRWVDLRPSDVAWRGEKLVVKGYETEFTGVDGAKLKIPTGRALLTVLGADPAVFGTGVTPTDPPAASWACAYCTGHNPATSFTCQGCGAPRTGR